MFLLNSRTTLIFASYNRNHSTTITGTPYAEGTGPNCRIPLIRLNLHTLGFSPRGTSVGSGYRYQRLILIPFSRALGINQMLEEHHS